MQSLFAPCGTVDVGQQGHFQMLPLELGAWQPIAWQVYRAPAACCPCNRVWWRFGKRRSAVVSEDFNVPHTI